MPDLVAHAQSSRFHYDTLEADQNIDLRDVTLSIDDHTLLKSAHVYLKQGTTYALIGRNGVGKSSLFTALEDKIIPGINLSLRITHLSQTENLINAFDGSVLEYVVAGDKECAKLVKRKADLERALAASTLQEAHEIVARIKLEDVEQEMAEIQLLAKRRSGARGKDMRGKEIAHEAKLENAKAFIGQSADANIMSTVAEMQTDVELQLDLLEYNTLHVRARAILNGLGFSEAQFADPYSSLSGGWRFRCSLAIALLVQSDVLLLDECTNFIDLEALLFVEKILKEREHIIVLTSHDQAFLDAVVHETIIFRNQDLKYFDGTPTAFQINERKEKINKAHQQEALDKKKEHIQSSIRSGIESGRKTGDDNRLRMAKSRQKKLDERFGIEQSAKGGRFKLNRDLMGYHLTKRADLTIEKDDAAAIINLPQPPSLRTIGNLFHLEKVAFTYPSKKGLPKNKPVFEDVTLTLGQGARLAIVGKNGQGKSTLAKIILGELKPTAGTIEHHPGVSVGYYAQHQVEFFSAEAVRDKNALQYYLDLMKEKGEVLEEQEIRKRLAAVGLQGRSVSDVPLVHLSGGQKVRLALASMLWPTPALLILDEVTTHIDVSTVQALASALRHYEGAIVLITHDRWVCRYVVEGFSFSRAFLEQQETDPASEDSEVEDAQIGRTIRVVNGKVKPLEKGIEQYEAIVRRKLDKMLVT